MTKQELVTALSSKFTKVAPDTDWITLRTIIGVDVIQVMVWKKIGEMMYENNIIVCRDGNSYYWKNGEPETVTFNQRVINFMNAKIADATIKYAVLNNINDSNKKATITAIMPDKSSKTVLLTETSENVFTIETI